MALLITKALMIFTEYLHCLLAHTISDRDFESLVYGAAPLLVSVGHYIYNHCNSHVTEVIYFFLQAQ